MRDLWAYILSGTAMISMVFIGISVHEYRKALADKDVAASQRSSLAKQVRQFQQLSEQQPDTIFGEQPQADFEQRISEAIRATGLDSRTRYSVRLQSDREHRDASQQITGLRQQSASVEIQNLTPIQIGAFLLYWDREEPLWKPEQIQMMHAQRSDQNLFSLNLNCVAVYYPQKKD